MNEKNDFGYLYIAMGESFVKEASLSASSLRKVAPNCHITLITDEPMSDNVFDQIAVKPLSDAAKKQSMTFQSGLLYKVENMYFQSPYSKTLFLDTDTYFYEDPSVLFRVLSGYDLGVIQAPNDITPLYKEDIWPVNLNFNTGVILFTKNERNDILFKGWVEDYEKACSKDCHDQPSFMRSISASQSKVCALSNIWNARIAYLLTLRDSVKIVHGRLDGFNDYEKLKNKINSSKDLRVWHPKKGKCFWAKPSDWRK